MKTNILLPLALAGIVSSGCMDSESAFHSTESGVVASDVSDTEDGFGEHETNLPGLPVRELIEGCLGVDATVCPDLVEGNDSEEDFAKWEECVGVSDSINSSMRTAVEWEIGMPIEELDEGPLPLPLTVCGYTSFVAGSYGSDDVDINILVSKLKILFGNQVDKVSARNCDVEDESVFVLSCEAESVASASEGYDADFGSLLVSNDVDSAFENLSAWIADDWSISDGEYDAVTVDGVQFLPSEEDGFSFRNTYSKLDLNILEIDRLAESLNGEPKPDNVKSATVYLLGEE